MGETERVVVDPYLDDVRWWELPEFDPETMHRAWASDQRNARDHPQFYRPSRISYPVLPRELVDRYEAARGAFAEVLGEVNAAIESAPRKTLNSYAVEQGWTIDDLRWRFAAR